MATPKHITNHAALLHAALSHAALLHAGLMYVALCLLLVAYLALVFSWQSSAPTSALSSNNVTNALMIKEINERTR